MSKEVFNSEFVKALYDQEKQLLTTVYLPATEYIFDAEWKKIMLELKEVAEDCAPKYIFDDNRERKYDYPPDIQDFILSTLVGSWNKFGLKKYVQILPKHLIGKITSDQIEYLVRNTYKPTFEIKFIDDYSEGERWLFHLGER